jgi:hypothetical protein
MSRSISILPDGEAPVGAQFDRGGSQDPRLNGVELEAMTAVALAALTIYDMCKGRIRP